MNFRLAVSFFLSVYLRVCVCAGVPAFVGSTRSLLVRGVISSSRGRLGRSRECSQSASKFSTQPALCRQEESSVSMKRPTNRRRLAERITHPCLRLLLSLHEWLGSHFRRSTRRSPPTIHRLRVSAESLSGQGFFFVLSISPCADFS